MKCPDCGVSGDHSMTCSWWNMKAATDPCPAALAAAKAELAGILPNLWNAIVENTKHDSAFWLGEILLSEITKETGYTGPQSR